jgi:hypothetical protein
MNLGTTVKNLIFFSSPNFKAILNYDLIIILNNSVGLHREEHSCAMNVGIS